MTMIVLEDLSVAIGDFRLDGINIKAGDGDYLVLLGPSGAGKTVLLELIAGLRTPDTGKITVNLRDMARRSPGTSWHGARLSGLFPFPPYDRWRKYRLRA